MPEILPGLPAEPSGPALSLSAGELPAELLAGLKPGDSLPARVLMQVAAGRYLLLMGGREVLAEAQLALAPGDRLALVVRQAGAQTLLDLVPLQHPSGVRPGGGQAVGPGAAAPPAAAPEVPAGERAGQEPLAAVAPRALRAELQSTLFRGAPLGELLAEALRSLAGSEPPAAAADAGQPAPAAASAASRELAARLRELLVGLPPSGPAGSTPVAPELGSRLAGLASALPAQVAELLAAVEARLAEALRALPGAAALGALLEALDALAARAGEAAPAAAAAPAPELRGKLVGLLDKLLNALDPAARADGRPPALPAALREAVEQLADGQRLALRQMVVERERALLGSSSQVGALAGAHRALSTAEERLGLARLWNLSASAGAQSFSCLEVPLAAGPEAGTARLTVMVRRSAGDGAGGESAPSGAKTVRAVLDLDLSALGQVWSELTLSGQDLAVKLELPDQARSRFVAARLGELKERLSAHGLATRVAAVVRTGRRRSGAQAPEGESAEGGGLDLWA